MVSEKCCLPDVHRVIAVDAIFLEFLLSLVSRIVIRLVLSEAEHFPGLPQVMLFATSRSSKGQILFKELTFPTLPMHL